MAAGLALVSHLLLGPIEKASNTDAGVALLAGIPAGAAIYLILARVLRAPELAELRAAMRKR